LLDDALSSVGKVLRLKVINNLAAMANHRGIVLVTQDVAMVRGFEQIIVLDDGNLVGDGRHEELITNCRTYTYLWDDPNPSTADTANNLLAGTYNVLVSDSNGCTETGLAIINDIGGGTAVITDSSSVLCNGGNNGDATVAM